MAYADEIDTIVRSQTALKEAFLSLERAAGEMGLRINEENTKYLTIRESKNQQSYFQIKNFNFEAVQSFTCLGSLINVNNVVFPELGRTVAATRVRGSDSNKVRF